MLEIMEVARALRDGVNLFACPPGLRAAGPAAADRGWLTEAGLGVGIA